MNKDFVSLLQKRIGGTSIGPSTARGMGPKGTIAAGRRFLQELQLQRLKVRSKKKFLEELDCLTAEFIDALPKEARHWGSSRKFLNIFLRGVHYNRFLCDFFNLYKIEPWLELPLDSHVAKGLKLEQGGKSLPRWTTVIGLTKAVSDDYQNFAELVARQVGTYRVHLDLKYWRGGHMANK